MKVVPHFFRKSILYIRGYSRVIRVTKNTFIRNNREFWSDWQSEYFELTGKVRGAEESASYRKLNYIREYMEWDEYKCASNYRRK